MATRLIFSGAKGVVAMAYSVHAEAAKQFMGRFYGKLATGVSLAEAVAAARLMVLNQPLRQSPTLRGGQSWVLITSRREESWLDCGYTLQTLGGLSEKDAEEFAAKVLRSAEVEREKLAPEYLELLELLQGHPLSLRVVLPHLKTQTPYAPEVINTLEKKLLVFYAELADDLLEQLIGDAELATFILRVEKPNLLQNLRRAEQQQEWLYAQIILQALGEVYTRSSRKPEFKSLRQRALKQIGIHLAQAKAKGKDAFNFWMYLRGVDANEAAESADLSTARAIYQEILDELTALNDPSVNDGIASLNHNLGNIALAQRQFEEAIAYYQQSRQIYEDAGDLYKAASVYHQLGIVAQEQRQFEEAIAYYQQSRQIYEDAGDLYKAASDYHQLGIVAQQQRQFEEAIAYYQQSRQIRESARDLYSAASDYHQLGVVAQEQRQFEEAIAYLQKALQIYESAGDLYKAASVYHQLGRVAQEQRQFEEAIAYYQKAFEIFQQFKDWRKASSTLRKWGSVLEAQENWNEAVQIYIQALAIEIEHNKEWIGWYIKALGRMLKVLGESQFEAVWREVRGEECAGEVRSAIWAASEVNEE